VVRLQLLVAALLGALLLPGAVAAVAVDGPAGLVLFAAALTATLAAAACYLTVVRLAPAAGPALTRGHALRERARNAAFIRQCDPDAAGRPRPRAPGAARAAA
jgi:hypothetical protein